MITVVVGCCFLCVVDVDILVGVVAGLSPFDDSRCIRRKMNVAATKKAAKKWKNDQNKKLPGSVLCFIGGLIFCNTRPFLKYALHFELLS